MTADRHVETQMVPGRRLGLRPPKNAPHLKVSSILTGTVPTHPASADNLEQATYGLYENDRFGDCGPTSAANMRRQVTRYLGGIEQDPTQADVFDLYRRAGNPNFDPNDPGGPGDGGVDMQTMLEAIHSGGIGSVQCVAFAKVDPSNLEEVRASIAVFGGLLLGVNLETAQQAQTNNGVWDYQDSSEWGGHAVLAGGYSGSSSGGDVEIITWAERVALTDQFRLHQVQEAWVVIWPEHLEHAAFLAGVNQAALAADYKALTGRDFPVQPQPGPAPVPGPPAVDPADQALVTALGPRLSEHHTGDNRRAAHAVEAWMAAKGLRAA